MTTFDKSYSKNHYSAEFQKTLVQFAKDGSIVAQNELVMSNTKFICGLAHKYKKSEHYTTEELVQEGVSGLIHAIYLFNPDNGANFLSYAVWWAKQRMSAYIRDKSRLIRQPANKQCDIGISVTQLSAPIVKGGELVGTIEELIEQSTFEPSDETMDSAVVRSEIEKMINQLSAKESTLIKDLFGFNGDTLAYTDIAEKLKVKPSALKFVRHQAIKNLRKKIEESGMAEEMLQYLR